MDDNESKEPPPAGGRIARIWRKHLRPILLVVLILTSFRSAIADWNDVPSGSMEPSILIGDRIFVNKLAYGLKIPYTTWHIARWDTPQRGEIVVFFSPVDGTRLVKRVVGVPGDEVRCINNRIHINGTPLTYSALPQSTINLLPAPQRGMHTYAVEQLGEDAHPVMDTPSVSAMRTFGPITVPAGEYFMMGDNRDNSNDSRFFGTVSIDRIVGRSSYVALSLDHDDRYLPRMDRFFAPLP